MNKNDDVGLNKPMREDEEDEYGEEAPEID